MIQFHHGPYDLVVSKTRTDIEILILCLNCDFIDCGYGYDNRLNLILISKIDRQLAGMPIFKTHVSMPTICFT